MSKQTVIRKGDKETTFLTQQYEVGLYLIINNDPSEQYNLRKSETKFHKDLRKNAIKKGDEVVEEKSSEL